MKIFLLSMLALALVWGGCSKKQKAEHAAAPESAPQTRSPVATETAQPKVTAPPEAVESVLHDFVSHMRTPDTLYVAFDNQDPPADLLKQVRTDQVLVLPASKKAANSERTTLILFPDNAKGTDSLRMIVQWRAGQQSGKGETVAIRQPDGWKIEWHWMR